MPPHFWRVTLHINSLPTKKEILSYLPELKDKYDRIQHFVLNMDDITYTREDIQATFTDMEEMGLVRLPYEEIILHVFMNGHNASVYYRETGDKEFSARVLIDTNILLEGVSPEVRVSLEGQFNEYSSKMAHVLFGLLVVMMATKGVEKSPIGGSKGLKLGVGSAKYGKCSYTYIHPAATIRGNQGDGGSKRPHLRRGHIRRQKYGRNYSMEKKIWIEPVLVNGETGEPEKREAYII